MAELTVPGVLQAQGAPTNGSHRNKGDWPMTRGGLLRANRAAIKGHIKTTPKTAWKAKVGSVPGSVMTADFDEDGQPETYAAENERIVKRDPQGNLVWKSPRITRGFTLVGFEDLDGDGKREPLMLGSGLNRMKPLYFIFDPHTGKIRWQVELNATNGADTRFGKIDPERKGLQLVRALFPNPGGGELHMFCWDEGIENGYALWSWERHNDFIYFPQLAVGDANNDGRNEVLMLSQMCVWMFDIRTGNEISRVFWSRRSRSYGGHFGLWPMKPGPTPSIVVISAYNKVSVVDCEDNKLKLRWNHEFEPGVGDSDLKGQVQFLQDGVCDVDGNGWAEVVCNEWAGYGDEKWRTVVLDARDGHALSETIGKVMVGAADIDGDGKAEVFLQDQVQRHDPIRGRVSVARWTPGEGLKIVWTAPADGSLVREPNAAELHLSRHPNEGDRVKLATGSAPGRHVFFLQAAGGQKIGYEATETGFQASAVPAQPDRVLPLAGLTATQSQPLDTPLSVDFDGDGVNETVQCTTDGSWAILKSPKGRQKQPTRIATLPATVDSPLFADLDGDGRAEVIAVRMGDSAGPEIKQQPCLEVRKVDGKLLWRRAWPADFAGKYTRQKGVFAIMFVSVGRFTGKNPLDVVISYTGEKLGGHTLVLDGATGATVWDIHKLYPEMYGECWDSNPPVVLDYDGDGLDDLATVCQTVHYTILRGKDGTPLIPKPWDVSGQSFGGEPALFPKGWAVGALLGGADANGDGKLELGVFRSQAAVGIIRLTGEQLWFDNLQVVNQVPTPGCWADVNGDGKAEAAFLHADGVVRVYEGATGVLHWEENIAALGSLMTADVDGDGAEELLVSSEKGILYCLGDKPAPITGSHVRWALEFEGMPGQAIFADVNGDGIGEIVVPTSDGYVHCLAARVS